MAEDAIKNSLKFTEAAGNAVEVGNYNDACKAYASASDACLNGLSELHCAHASALVSAEDFDKAKNVAEQALKISPRHSQSWYWKGTALLKLNRHEDAKAAFQKAATYEDDLVKKTSFMDWVGRCDNEPMEVIDATAQTVDAKVDVTGVSVSQIPTEAKPSEVSRKENSKPVPKTRREWYQSATYVNIDIYAKNVDKDQSRVSFEEDEIHIRLVRAGNDDYVFDAKLFASVVPSESSWSASKFKVEIKLKKSRNGEVWRALDREAQVLSAQVQAGQESIRRRDQQEARQRGLTSFAESELKNYKEDDSAMSLFRTIYKDADEDMRRAMMKSYSESGGKVLSTNWDDVRKEKVTYKEDE
ncbi:HSP20-like chaperone [Gracilaria domingensis]|nr:HSP20-like chaperone [Gracilaria domingensis]